MAFVLFLRLLSDAIAEHGDEAPRGGHASALREQLNVTKKDVRP